MSVPAHSHGRRGAAPFDPTGLHVLSYAAGFTLWHYRSAAPLEAVARPGYFNPARELLRAGDRLSVSVHEAAGFRAACDFCIVAAGPPDVVLAPLTPAVAAGSAATGT